MLSENAKKVLEKQQYRIIGSHSAVKVCGWTKSAIKDNGFCYKYRFYGIASHQCMQMTTSISCANRCTFCWRGYKAPVSKDWKWNVDNPEYILKNSIEAHHKLLVGLKGYDKRNKALYEASRNVKHVALSLTGEPIIYPKINELIELFHKEKISTFLVTNAQYPKAIEELKDITQLYISLDAPNKDILKEIDKPLFEDYWERLIKSLKAMKEKKHRTCIRLTLIKGINMIEAENYAKLIKLAEPDFLELKAYMFLGASRERLKKENSPFLEDISEFTEKLLKHLPEYAVVSAHKPSKVIMLANKKHFKNNKWHTWIDYEKFFNGIIESEKYSKKTPSAFIDDKKSLKEIWS